MVRLDVAIEWEHDVANVQHDLPHQRRSDFTGRSQALSPVRPAAALGAEASRAGQKRAVQVRAEARPRLGGDRHLPSRPHQFHGAVDAPHPVGSAEESGKGVGGFPDPQHTCAAGKDGLGFRRVDESFEGQIDDEVALAEQIHHMGEVNQNGGRA